MRCSSEMRREARQMLRGGWFWRILTVIVILQGVANAVIGFLDGVHREMGIVRPSDFCEAKLKALQQGLEYSLPTSSDFARMLGAGCLEIFLGYVFAAIAAFGLASVLLKAVRCEDERWLADSFEGFRRPLGVAWLLIVQNSLIALWSLLFVIPGIIAIYRYRQAWYLKCENPDWSATRCLSESSRMMAGYKLAAFRLDFSYFGWFLLLSFTLGCLVVFSRFEGLGALKMLAFLPGVLLVGYVLVYFLAGRTVFYRELKSLRPPSCPAES